MTKTELKSLTDEMCISINNLIDNNDDISKEQFSDFLINSANLVSEVSQDELDAYQKSKELLIDSFKDIADKCITSYKQSNTKFSELSKIHADKIDQFQENHIDIPDLTNMFSEIQSHMVDEVSRANNVIAELSKQVLLLEKKSNLDPLTKVYNRGALNHYLSELCLNANSNYNTFMLMIDVDNFKDINTKYGHVAGDKILIFISNILKKTLRDGDKVYRYGGDEFIIILNRLDENKALNIGNRILKLVSDNKLIYRGQNISVTMSMGATKFNLGDTQNKFIARADSALYNSKRNGKNQLSMESA